MQKHTFSIHIEAPKETVWNILWAETTYPEWTAIFGPGSRAETDWQEGSKVLFLGSKNEGMVSTIYRRIDNEYMAFKHLGIFKNGVEDLDSPETKAWAGAMENYTLTAVGDQTNLEVEMDIAEEHLAYFRSTWPKALEKVKALAESVAV